MARFDTTSPRLLNPPTEEEEIYPYRRVWPSLIIEMILLFMIAAGLFVAGGYLGITVPEALRVPVNYGLALVPALLWLILSRWRENFVPEPRPHMTSVFVISALVANALAVPLLGFLDAEQWLSGQETVNRWIGYTVTVGITHELMKYIVLRYLVWQDALRNRLDMVAYAMTSAIGYVTVFNLRYVAEGVVASDVVASQVFANTSIQVAAGLVMAYGMAELRFNPRALVILPGSLLVAAFIHGLATPTRAGLVRANFVLGVAGIRPFFGLVFPVVIIGGVTVAMIFLFSVAESRAERAHASREV